MLITEICLGAATVPPLFCFLKDIDYRGKISMLCEFLSVDPEIAPDLARDAFASCCVPAPYVVTGHSHPDAAAARSAATLFTKDVAHSCGTDLYFVQMSKSDQRKGYKGSRQTWWAKDTNVENRSDKKRDDDMVAIIDTDYYMDMNYQLGGKPRPTLLYTAVPSAAATQDEDSFTSFDDKGQLVTIISGSGTYTHHLWDYAADCLIVKKSVFGILYRMTTYAVERKQVTNNRQVILLAPIKVYHGPVAWLAFCLIDGKVLARFDPVVKARDGSKFIRFNVHKREGTFVTTGRPGEALAATISMADDNAIACVARMGTTNLMIPTTASWLPPAVGSTPTATLHAKRQATVLTEYHRLAIPRKVPIVFPVEKAVRSYQFNPGTYNPEARTKVMAFMSPLVHRAFAPANTSANDAQAIRGRITELRKKEPSACPTISKFMEEFVEFVCRGAVLHPCDYDTIADRQTSAPQVVSLRRATVTGVQWKRMVKSFIKGEAYSDVKDGRIITTFDDLQKLMLAQFALPAADHMKQFEWYGPGKTPQEIAERMAVICVLAKFLNISDYKRMDGTITHYLRLLDRCLMLKLFPSHRAVLNELLKKTANNTGFLNEQKYEQGPAQGSGCSLTSLLQTNRAAFCSYCAYRHVRDDDGAYVYTALQAFEMLGLHNGDDGADPDLPVPEHLWASNKLGLLLEASTVEKGFVGVNFLARFYSDKIWKGCPDSMCDIKRQLSKFHTTLRLPASITPEHKLVEKAMAFVATDGNTPIIGPLCKKVLTLSTYRPQAPLGVGYWWGRFEQSTQYPNNNVDGWMDVELERMFPEFDRNMFDEWLASAQQMPQILAAPLCAEPVPARPSTPVVVDDEVIVPATPPPVTEAATSRVPRSQNGRGRGRGGRTPRGRGRGRGASPNPRQRADVEPQQQQPPRQSRRNPNARPAYQRVHRD